VNKYRVTERLTWVALLALTVLYYNHSRDVAERKHKREVAKVREVSRKLAVATDSLIWGYEVREAYCNAWIEEATRHGVVAEH
jgi:hypothetical protein